MFFMRCMPRHLIHDRCFYKWRRLRVRLWTAPLIETTIVYQVTWHASLLMKNKRLSHHHMVPGELPDA